MRRKGSDAEEGLNAQAKLYQDQLAQLKLHHEQMDNILNLVKSTFKDITKNTPTAFFKTPTSSPKPSPRDTPPTDAPSSKNTTPRKD